MGFWNSLASPQTMMEEYYKQLGFTSDNSGLLELIKNQKMVDALEMKSDSTTKDVH